MRLPLCLLGLGPLALTLQVAPPGECLAPAPRSLEMGGFGKGGPCSALGMAGLGSHALGQGPASVLRFLTDHDS